jgi:hypothetical protein
MASLIQRTTPNKKDGWIRFNGEGFAINRHTFASYSCVAQEVMSNVVTRTEQEFIIEEDVSRDAVLQFINACQGLTYEITNRNLLDFGLLCRKFED